MKKLTCIFILLALTTMAFADRGSCCGCWSASGSYLYLLPSVDDTYFVVSGAPGSSINGTRENNDFNFSSGFRVAGAYDFCDCARTFELSYSRLREKKSKRVSGDALWATVGNEFVARSFSGFAGIASSSNDLLYQRLDALFNQQMLSCCQLDLSFVAGMELAYCRLNNAVRYQISAASFGDVNQHSRSWGVGPQLGIDGEYAICSFSDSCPGLVSLHVLSSGSLLASKIRYKTNQFTTQFVQGDFDIVDEGTWRVVPVFHTRMGLNYTACFPCMTTVFEIGYEFSVYFRNINSIVFADDVRSVAFTKYTDFDLQGLYISAIFTF